jgi:hypothetical protein
MADMLLDPYPIQKSGKPLASTAETTRDCTARKDIPARYIGCSLADHSYHLMKDP